MLQRSGEYLAWVGCGLFSVLREIDSECIVHVILIPLLNNER